MSDENVLELPSQSSATEPLDLNRASLRGLVQLPGVGRALARRIIEARPFSSVEDLRRVEGIGETLIGKIAPMVFIAAPSPVEPAEADGESVAAPPAEPAPPPADADDASAATGAARAVIPPGEPFEKVKPVETGAPGKEEKPPTAANAIIPYPARSPKYATQTYVLWTVIAGSLLAFILALILSLAVLASLNNGLRFVSPAELSPLHSSLDTLDAKTEALADDLDSLRARLDNLEGLSGRMTSLEQDNQDIKQQLQAASVELEKVHQTVQEMNNQITQIQSTVQDVQTQTQKFQDFLDGLAKLLNAIK